MRSCLLMPEAEDVNRASLPARPIRKDEETDASKDDCRSCPNFLLSKENTST
jgi:hypothetical protein